MKDYTMTNANGTVNFSVDEDWLETVKIRATEDVTEQIYNAALSDPEVSHITTDDDVLNKSIDEIKALVTKVKDINKEKNSDIRVMIEKGGTYAVKFAGQIYSSNLRLKDTQNAIEKIKAYLDHNNLVKVRVFKSDKSVIQRAMELETFIAKRAHKVISISDNGETYTLVYIEKGSCRCTNDDFDDYSSDEI